MARPRWQRRDPTRVRASVLLVVSGTIFLASGLVRAAGIADADAILEMPPLARPPAGTSFVDPVFGTTIRRVSAASVSGGFETPTYSQLQAFDAAGQYLLTTGSLGYNVRRVDDLSLVPSLDLADVNVPRWHQARPHVLLHFDTNADDDLTLQATDVDTGQTEGPGDTSRVHGPPERPVLR